jgi:aspartyl-tRNA(Asn)/glutamyl-tRNA(Gln) amidotransferase subunit A
MARTPADAALLLGALVDLSGEVPGGDVGAWVATLHRAQGEPDAGPRSLAGMSVGLLTGTDGPAPTSDVTEAVETAAARLGALGASVVPVDPPGGAALSEVFTAILLSEALAGHRERGLLPARRAEYGSDVRTRIDLAGTLDAARIARAQVERDRLRHDVRTLFAEVDLLLGPVCAGPPPRLGEEPVAHHGQQVPLRLLLHPWVALQNLTGLPACALPTGFDAMGLPLAVQITGRPGADTAVLEVAAALYGSTSPPHRRPATAVGDR